VVIPRGVYSFGKRKTKPQTLEKERIGLLW
jgi:hypothetical protein